MASTPDSTSRSEDRLLYLLGQHTLRLSELEAENKALQARISELLQTQNGSTESRAPTSAEDNSTLRQAYDALVAQNAETERLLQAATNKYATARQRVFEWQAYTQKLTAKYDKIKSKASKRSSSARQSPLATESTPEPYDLPKNTSPITSTKASKGVVTTRTTSSQSTIYEPQPEQDQPQYVEDDEPVVVSERRLKRRRLDPKRSPRIKQEGVSASTPFVIPSDPPGAVPAKHLETQTSDLNPTTNEETKTDAHENGLHATTGSDIGATLQPSKKRPALQELSSNIPNSKQGSPFQHGNKKVTTKSSLRSMPIEKLQLGDFRQNPYYTGPAMTFYEPLKADTTRVCLPSCTRAACCGNKYRKVIEIGGAQVSGKTNEEVLEGYFGPKWMDILETYPVAQRKDVVKQAHALSFAKQSGVKSKNPIRPPTPPGIWRTDMPSTQELQAFRDEADAVERHRIAERYHEATREGGQWLFRDEV